VVVTVAIALSSLHAARTPRSSSAGGRRREIERPVTGR
jgi:hypothetical protein